MSGSKALPYKKAQSAQVEQGVISHCGRTSSLVGGSLGAGEDLQGVHAHLGIVHLHPSRRLSLWSIWEPEMLYSWTGCQLVRQSHMSPGSDLQMPCAEPSSMQ